MTGTSGLSGSGPEWSLDTAAGGCDPASCVQAPGWGRGPQSTPCPEVGLQGCLSARGGHWKGQAPGLLSSPNSGVWVDHSYALFLSGLL